MFELSTSQLHIHFRRAALAIMAAGSTALAAWLMSEVLANNGLGLIGCLLLILFTLNFGWLAVNFWTAALGFMVRLSNGVGFMPPTSPSRTLTVRTALLMPIRNEDVAAVSAGLEAMLSAITDEAEHFDLFVLSDTSDEKVAASERQMIAYLRHEHRAGSHIYYRQRKNNVGRKAGNIGDFVQRWGAAYAHMIVLDADSIMSGDTIVMLARLMEARPDAGIIQTLPVPSNRETAFARILQFANRLYGPVIFSGLACWTGGDGIYYGHNAIIRTAAFAKNCGLPVLPGKAPLGGEILSHDFVEGALICSGGYKVWLVPQLPGSYEGMPANVIDYATRDRRWCQGNLQHSRLLRLPVLKPIGRLHLSLGIFSYLTSPLWFALLILSSMDAAHRTLAAAVYFKPGFNLFPDWPVATDFQIDVLLCMTIAALILPKLMALILTLLDSGQRGAFGGLWRLFASVLGEIIFSGLLAPVMMLNQTRFVVETFLGRSVIWRAQPRDDRGVSWLEGLQRHGWQTLLGFAWAFGVYKTAPVFFWWLTPIWLGLAFAVPLSVWSSRSYVGHALRHIGLFLTPEETRPPAELIYLRRAVRFPLDWELPELSASSDSLVPAESGLTMPNLPWPRRRQSAATEIRFVPPDVG